MRLLGRSAAPIPLEEVRQPEAEEEPPAPRTPDYTQLGEHVTAVLNTAEKAAEQIRAAALEEAARIREEADQEASASNRDAAQRRHEADQEARRKIAEAEAGARTTREAAERSARETEAQAKRRQQELRDEIRVIDENRQRALLELRDIVAQLQNVLLEAPVSREEPLHDEEREAPAPRPSGGPRPLSAAQSGPHDQDDAALDDPVTEAFGVERS